MCACAIKRRQSLTRYNLYPAIRKDSVSVNTHGSGVSNGHNTRYTRYKDNSNVFCTIYWLTGN